MLRGEESQKKGERQRGASEVESGPKKGRFHL